MMYSTRSLPKPDYVATLNYANAGNSDIRSIIHENFSQALAQTKEFAKQFHGHSAIDTAQKVWKFLKTHQHYTRDKDTDQLVRLPSRFVADGTGDCKSYALFAASILANLGLPVAFRYASYTNSSIPSHVYVVTKDENGNEIIVDGVWKYFNSEKKPSYKFDEPMRVYTLSGTQEWNEHLTGIGKHGRGKRKLKKYGLAAPRRAFNTLLSLNAFGLAKKFARVARRNPGGLSKKWKQLGGKPSSLQRSINRGLKHIKSKNRPAPVTIKGIEGVQMDSRMAVGMFGTDTVEHMACAGIGAIQFAALMAAAGAILLALAPLLKKHGEEPLPGEGEEDAQSKTTVERVLDAAGAAAKELGAPSQPADELIAQDKADPEPHKSDEAGFSASPLLLLGGGALLLMATSSNKK